MDVEGFVQHVETSTEFLVVIGFVKVFFWENKQGKKQAKKMVLFFFFFFTKIHCTFSKFDQFWFCCLIFKSFDPLTLSLVLFGFDFIVQKTLVHNR